MPSYNSAYTGAQIDAAIAEAQTALQPADVGTAAALNVPATGNATSGQVVKGDDTRLSDARTPTAHTHPIDQVTGLQTALDGLGTEIDGKQDTLVSGTNIKTVGGTSILGAGDIPFPSGGTIVSTDISDSTAAGRTLLTAANVAAQRTALELGTAALAATGDFATAAQGTLADSAVQPGDNLTTTDVRATGSAGVVIKNSGGTAVATVGPANGTGVTFAGGVNTGALGVTGNIAVSGTVDGRDIAADGTKLDGIATGATANSSDATLLNRANHTGTQLAATISDFATAVAATAAVTANTAKVTNATHTGEVTGATALTITAGAVTLSKMANLATSTIIGRATAGTGVPEALSAAQVRTILGLAAVATSGSAADLSTGTLPAARMPALTGDVTTTAGAVATTIANSAVTFAKMANLAQNTIIGRVTASTGVPEALTAANVRTITETESTTQLNTRDTNNRARANHTGTQLASTISDFNTAADARITASNKVSSDTTGITGADQITNMVSLTQAEYDAIGTKNGSTLYVIV